MNNGPILPKNIIFRAQKSVFWGFGKFFEKDRFFFSFLLNYKYGKNWLKPKKIHTLWGLALSAGRYSIFRAMTIKNRKNLKSWDFLNPGTYFGPLQSLFIISTKFLYQQCHKFTKVPTGVKFGVFLGIWKIGCTTSVLRFKKFSYMPVLMSQGGVFHRGVKPPNSEKVYHKSVVAQWLPHLTKKILS